MKTAFIGFITALLVVAVAGYFGLPILIDRETSGLKQELQDVKQRLQKIEEESKVVPLKTDADTGKIVKTLNALSLQVKSMDDSFKKDISALKDTLKNLRTENAEGLKKQAESADKTQKETEAQIQKIRFYAAVTNIREHVLRIKLDLESKNIGTAKNELNLIEGEIEKVKASVPDGIKKSLGEMQATLNKAKAEIDTDLPSSINRIDLIWHEMNKLIRDV
jgi:chromosome segregation ATPase